MSETEYEIMPSFDLFPRISRVAHFILDHLHYGNLTDQTDPEPPMDVVEA